MVEALFFADSKALELAGVPEGATDAFPPNKDPEQFEITDDAYLNETEEACPCFKRLATTRKKKQRPKWLGMPQWWRPNEGDMHTRAISWRKGHPKGYLQWLCKDGNQKNCTTYDETIGGGRALSALSWPALLGREQHFEYLRALICDVSNKLGQDPATGKIIGKIAVLTDPSCQRPNPVLRNL